MTDSLRVASLDQDHSSSNIERDEIESSNILLQSPNLDKPSRTMSVSIYADKQTQTEAYEYIRSVAIMSKKKLVNTRRYHKITELLQKTVEKKESYAFLVTTTTLVH